MKLKTLRSRAISGPYPS